jgi:hypothetical protein
VPRGPSWRATIPAGHLDIVFALADRHGTRIDIHLHDGGSPGTWHLELIIEGPGRPDSAAGPQSATRTAWYRPIRPPRTASPGNWPMRGQPRHRRRVQPPVLAIVRLRAAGVTIACGHDGIGTCGALVSGRLVHRHPDEPRVRGNSCGQITKGLAVADRTPARLRPPLPDPDAEPAHAAPVLRHAFRHCPAVTR